MRIVPILGLALVGCASTGSMSRPASPTTAESSRPGDTAGVAKRYFYTGKSYGTESQFNPLTVVLNEGYDILQIPGTDRRVFRFNYGGSFGNVVRNLRNPVPVVRAYGVGDFVRHELLPLSGPPDGGQWVPNYTQHLIGGGMSFARTREWYEAHGASAPLAFTIGTIGVSRLLNEVMENGTWRGRGTDPIADLFFFDAGGAALFSSERVRDLFSTRLNLTAWPGQPSLTVPDLELHNVFTSYVIKWRFPKSERWHLFYYFGENPLGGVSFRTTAGHSFTLASGGTVTELPVLDSLTNRKGVRLKESSGIFWDRDNSLMASVIYGVHPNRLIVNLYPGTITLGRWRPGLWARLPSEGGLQVGLSATPWLPGMANVPR